jgi:GT2 family glycosyltransferase
VNEVTQIRRASPPLAEARPSVAVLVTCHNRRAKTLLALQRLHAQAGAPCTLSVYLVDDGSSDGTAERVAHSYPGVRVIPGDGTLFWGGGMALAFGAAAAEDHDFFLWLNDDTYLFDDAVRHMLQTYQQVRPVCTKDSIVVGSTRSETSARANTGGRLRCRWRRFRFDVVEPGDRPVRCDTFNGNCVLIPRRVADEIGGPDAAFRHHIGDFDYGLRASWNGFESWVAPGFIGTCEIERPAVVDTRGFRALFRILAKLCDPKGVQLEDGRLYSFQEWARFARRHGGPFWLIYFLSPYRRLLKCLISQPRLTFGSRSR